jgi:hypothetical protein
MVEKTMILIAEKHKTWIEIVTSFGCPAETSEDIVQEMYIKIHKKLNKGLDIMYKDEVNYYYIFKTLKTLFYDLKRKEKNIIIVNIDDNINELIAPENIDYSINYKKVNLLLSKMYWYDRKVFEIINSGESIATLSKKTGIVYHSLYNTYIKVKNEIKKIL